MGKQIRFFRSPSVERRFFAAARSIELQLFGGDRTPFQPRAAEGSSNREFALGFKAPVESWPFNSEYIQYSRGADSFSARLWFEPRKSDGSLKSASISDAYSTLVREIKRAADYHRESGLWVKRSEAEEFREVWSRHQRDLQAVVDRNRRYAVSALGARLRKKNGA